MENTYYGIEKLAEMPKDIQKIEDKEKRHDDMINKKFSKEIGIRNKSALLGVGAGSAIGAAIARLGGKKGFLGRAIGMGLAGGAVGGIAGAVRATDANVRSNPMYRRALDKDPLTTEEHVKLMQYYMNK